MDSYRAGDDIHVKSANTNASKVMKGSRRRKMQEVRRDSMDKSDLTHDTVETLKSSAQNNIAKPSETIARVTKGSFTSNPLTAAFETELPAEAVALEAAPELVAVLLDSAKALYAVKVLPVVGGLIANTIPAWQ